MIIIPTGFYGTGSSAITDLMKEYSNVACKSDYELRFLFDPDGVSDLEYNLIENPNRHNSSHALKRFIKAMNNLDHVWMVKRYYRYFDGKFMPIVNQYVSKLVLTSYKGMWHYDIYEKGKLFYIFSRMYSKLTTKINSFLKIRSYGNELGSKNEKSYLTITNEKEFVTATQSFVDDIAKALNPENKNYVVMDQLMPPSNIQRYIRYVRNAKVIIVDRDPRDIYIMEKEIWKGTIVPTDDVKIFCEWYEWTRKTAENNKEFENVLYVNFEDLIYRYDETVIKIEEFNGFEKNNHRFPKKYFNPDVSINNTQLWKEKRNYLQDVNYIENRLEKYCYKFPSNIKFKNRKATDCF